MFTAAQITAACAVLTLCGAVVMVYTRRVSDVAKLSAEYDALTKRFDELKATVDSLDLELAKMVRGQMRLENMLVAVLGAQHPLAREAREEN